MAPQLRLSLAAAAARRVDEQQAAGTPHQDRQPLSVNGGSPRHPRGERGGRGGRGRRQARGVAAASAHAAASAASAA
eukprot:CAMPEP_0202784756 /NCGR_PEP_ID=MMETSP1388-20130828/67025_1 /ASSEMBLY_ACC=CAM_ASM_000864 /TAXON_ID=37098 /ORGANISM="Isochrysis sp, Strain CCMP1244" /LENGTH=76 /DNA_ID=CAMNT_0049454263 /DNA_START=27 /DNA_END=253 /DNA_ORIENTATION=-